jgi:hypothetical protein
MSEFSKSWGHRREDLVGNVRALADQVYGVVSELMRTDSTLAKSLTDGQAPT